MKRLAAVVVISLAVCALALPAQADFKRIVRQIETEGRIRHRWIPMLSLARLAVKMNPVDGVSDFRLAVFDRNPLDEGRIDSIVRDSVSEAWSPVIGVREADGTVARIYMRDLEEKIALLIVASENEEIVVMQLRVDPEKVAQMIEKDGAISASGVGW